MTNTYKESNYEQAIMELFSGLDYQTLYAPDIERNLTYLRENSPASIGGGMNRALTTKIFCL